jgi:heptosyltransferase-2
LKQILIIRLSSIGDIVLTTPILRQLKSTFPNATIDALTKPAYSTILHGNPALRTIFTAENFKPELRYDLIVDLQNNLTSRKYHRLGEKIVVYRKENWKKFLLVHFKVNLYQGYESVVERYAKSLAPFGVRLDEKGCEIFLSHEEEKFGKEHRTAEMPVLAVCFGAKHFTKRFPSERFASALNHLLEKKVMEVWLLGGKEDAPFAKMILEQVKRKETVKDFSGKYTLRETASLLASADAVLSNDTGLMHIAAAFQKPIVVLFGSSVKEFGFLPYKVPFSLLEVEGLACRPCSHIGRKRCPKSHFKCMHEIPEERILRAIENALKQGKKSK